LFPEFQFDFALPALKVELRELSRDDQQSESEMLKQIVFMDDWRVCRRFDFIRHIRMMLDRGFRRQGVRPVIAELRLLRHFLAMILDRSETGRDDGEGFGCD
jgi:hypothetical protein